MVLYSVTEIWRLLSEPMCFWLHNLTKHICIDHCSLDSKKRLVTIVTSIATTCQNNNNFPHFLIELSKTYGTWRLHKFCVLVDPRNWFIVSSQFFMLSKPPYVATMMHPFPTVHFHFWQALPAWKLKHEHSSNSNSSSFAVHSPFAMVAPPSSSTATTATATATTTTCNN